MTTLPRTAARTCIRGYQRLVSPWLPPCCRFLPTCSAYALEAVDRHGVVKGLRLGVLRILRCHPLHAGGHDPVPLALSGPSNRGARQGDGGSRVNPAGS